MSHCDWLTCPWCLYPWRLSLCLCSADESNQFRKEDSRLWERLRAREVPNFQDIKEEGELDQVYVIEANPRASRTTPFIAKAYKAPYLKIATQVMMGTKKLSDFKIQARPSGFAIKVPVFSFNKFPNVDKNLGPEMKSTGEEIRFIKDLTDPFFRELDRQRYMYLAR